MSKQSRSPKVEPFTEDPERVMKNFQRLLKVSDGIENKEARVKAMVNEYRKMKAEREAEEAEKTRNPK